MFQTSKDMQLFSDPGVSSLKRQQWHSLTQTLLIRWFQVRYVCADSLSEQILITGDLDVLAAVNADPSFLLVGVNLVSPPYINGTNNWALSPLRRVTTLSRHNLNMEELLGYEYHLDEGRIIFEKFGSALRLDPIGVERTELLIRNAPIPQLQLISP